MVINPSYFSRLSSAAPLVVFRIFFGGLMLVSMLRFWLLGWIDKLYIKPIFFFLILGLSGLNP